MTETQGRAQGRDASETREALLRIAIELIERDGESALRVGDVAAAAGTSVGTLYHHFGDREGLVEAARAVQFRRHVDADAAMMKAAIEEASTLAEFDGVLERFAGITETAQRREANWARIDVLGCARRRPRLVASLAEEQERLSALLTDVCRLAQTKGFLDPAVDPRALAVFMQAYSMGRVVGALPGTTPLEPDAWSKLIVRVFRGLAPGADARSNS